MKTFNLRLPDELHEWLKSEAEDEQRSMNSQITWLLQQAANAERATP